ncbi:beta-propeller domain-containing protein [Methanolapillus millepedarum]|uniref:Copper amine oxidase n=1 Tax=Methanolapillus millepedarum TaxID=3028296 RepID=A0AA96V3X8_9EURY|nr:hypothetical protein MsAc7_07720 [Methanosarcinaceae archaeon Ac7]
MKHMKLSTLAILGLVLICSLGISGCLSGNNQTGVADEVGMVPFTSEKQMQAYFSGNFSGDSYYGRDSFVRTGMVMEEGSVAGTGAVNNTGIISVSNNTTPASPSPISMDLKSNDMYYDTDAGSVDRVSGTNVQVQGVDEADIVKTDGNTIYYTPQVWYPTNMTLINNTYGSYYQYETFQTTFTIDALPPETADIISSIGAGGDLYLVNDTLIVIKNEALSAYNISDPSQPVLVWNEELDGYYRDSRMIDGKLYMVVQKYDLNGDGPIVYMDAKIDYNRCYYPVGPSIIHPSTDTTYFVSAVDIGNGHFGDTVALIGSYDSLLYASGNNLYLTNYFYPDTTAIELQFIQEHGSEYYPQETMNQINRVMGTDYLSESVKYNAVMEAVYSYIKTLTSEEQENYYNSYQKAYSAYLMDAIKDKETTTISKINLETFDVTTGTVPGRINDQFSIDEYDGYLRVATTVGSGWLTRDEQTNGVYVLDSNMKTVGQVTGLAQGERVYSARYVGDRLYLVTYKQIDPFFVVDLSDPQNPSVLGELKLPGYSTYLHPISENLVVGLGYADDWKMKLTLFDVTNVNSPVELDSYTFSNYSHSSALHDHHAFMWDADRNLLVLPTYEHAYVMEIKDGNISMVKDDVHKNATVIRSVYINNYLYTFSDKEIHILNQDTWELVKKISIPQPNYPENMYRPHPVSYY